MKKIFAWLRKCNWLVIVTCLIASLMGGYLALRLPRPEKPAEVIHDTIYVQLPLPDSLLNRIATEVSEINSKLTPKKVYIRKRPNTLDTIRIDASVKLENK